MQDNFIFDFDPFYFLDFEGLVDSTTTEQQEFHFPQQQQDFCENITFVNANDKDSDVSSGDNFNDLLKNFFTVPVQTTNDISTPSSLNSCHSTNNTQTIIEECKLIENDKIILNDEIFRIKINSNLTSSLNDMNAIAISCQEGLEMNKKAKPTKYSVYVNDTLNVNIPNNCKFHLATVELRVILKSSEMTTFFEENLEENTIVELKQVIHITNNTSTISTIDFPIKRDNSSKRRVRNEAKQEKKANSNSGCTRKIGFIQIVDSEGNVLLRTESFWCKSKSREEMRKKKMQEKLKRGEKRKRKGSKEDENLIQEEEKKIKTNVFQMSI
ncbi:hypothetical protein ABK040_001263 [Willaertia magna]